MNKPIFFFMRDKKYPPPTSVKNPSFASIKWMKILKKKFYLPGIANIDFSVQILIGELILIPTPPPITIPSIIVIYIGFIVATL